MTPAVGARNPATRFRNVVLPHPEPPTRQTNSPSATSRLKSFSATTSPCRPLSKTLVTLSATMMLSATSAVPPPRVALPRKDAVLDQAEEGVDHEHRDADRHHADHDQRHVVPVLREPDQRAEPVRGRDHLGAQHARPRERETHLEAADDARERAWQDDFPQHVDPARAEVLRRFDQKGIDPSRALHDVEER